MTIRCLGALLLVWVLACAATALTTAPMGQNAVDPGQVLDLEGRLVIVDASTRTVTFQGIPLAEAQGAVAAGVLRGRLLVALRDGVVLLYDLPAPETDGPPVLAQRIEGLGRDVRTMVCDPLIERAMVLAAGSTEIFGIDIYDQKLFDEGEVDQPAYVDHARFLEVLREGEGGAQPGLRLAVGPQKIALVKPGEILELFHLNRGYEVLQRSPWPEGVARIESIAYTGSRWILAGLDGMAEPVLLSAPGTEGPWTDLGSGALDEALAGDGGPIAWLPGGLTITDEAVSMAIRGERPAVARWPLSSDELQSKAIEIRWLADAATEVSP